MLNIALQSLYSCFYPSRHVGHCPSYFRDTVLGKPAWQCSSSNHIRIHDGYLGSSKHGDIDGWNYSTSRWL